MKARQLVLVAVAVAALAGGLAAARAATAGSPTFVINRQIGGVHIGESQAKVAYYYGTECAQGCPGHQEQGACVLMVYDGHCNGPFFDYKVAGGGYLRIGYYQRRVVYLETNSRRFRTSSGLGVGSRIPFGKRWGQFRWHACGPGGGGYWAAQSTPWGKTVPRSQQKTTSWTQVGVSKGAVDIIDMMRGDVLYQGC